jgi:hypothetical protein
MSLEDRLQRTIPVLPIRGQGGEIAFIWHADDTQSLGRDRDIEWLSSISLVAVPTKVSHLFLLFPGN